VRCRCAQLLLISRCCAALMIIWCAAGSSPKRGTPYMHAPPGPVKSRLIVFRLERQNF
jgi:hypothetical protein